MAQSARAAFAWLQLLGFGARALENPLMAINLRLSTSNIEALPSLLAASPGERLQNNMTSTDNPKHSVAISTDGLFIHYRSRASARTPTEMAERVRATVELGRRHQLTRLMFDCRDTLSRLAIAVQYEFAYQQAGKLGLGRDWQIAFVVSPGDRSYDFMETALVNSGYNARLFSDFDQAVAWLALLPPVFP